METYQALWHSVAWFWKHGWDRNRLAHRYCWSHEGLTKCCGVWSVWWRDFGWNKWSVAKESRYNKVQQGAHSLGSGHTLLLSIKKQMVWKDADLASCLLNVGLARCCFNEGVVCLVMSGCNVTLCSVLVLMAILICNPPWVGLCPWWTW